MTQEMNHTFVKAFRAMLVAALLLVTSTKAIADGDTQTGVRVSGSVYGGGNLATVGGSVTINMTAGTVEKDVYGGGALANTNIKNVTEGYGTSSETIPSTSTNTTTVNLLGGTIVGDAYGGGLGQQANNNVSPALTAVEAKVYGDVKIYLNGMDKSFYDAADATMKAVFDTRITKTGATYYLVKTDTKGAVVKRIFGANNKNGSPQGDVAVHVFGTQHKDAENIRTKLKNANADLEKGSQTDEEYIAVLKGVLTDMITKAGILNITVTNNEGTGYQDICNNTSSTAEDLKKAINDINDEINAKILDENTSTDDIDELFAQIYDVEAVYGGGNEAAYIPATAWNGSTGSKTQVIIEGCDETSIEAVYGGGNAASVPETNVDILSAHEIQTVFGGGNGKDNRSDGSANPGADVGVYKVGETETTYGTGNATTRLIGGYFHEAYGASNSKGNIKGNISINTAPAGVCNLKYDKLVGAGKNADVDKDVIMILGCNPKTKNPLIFGGADNANVKGNVELTITSGNFGKVFGGNNEGGAIFGHIKLNIEETGGCETPITIDELYLGGNMAAYSQYGYYQDGTIPGSTKPLYKPIESASDNTHTAVNFGGGGSNDHTKAPYSQPELNVISCTYIGKVFGGGYGSGAALYGNPIVNINMIQGSKADGVPAIMDAKGLPSTENTSHLGIIGDVFGGGNAADVIGNTTVNIGTETTVTMISVDDDDTTTDVDEKHPNVLGAYITGNVYGGGNEANVTGDTQVNICVKKNSSNVYENVTPGTAGVTIGGDVFGAGKGVNTDVTKALVEGNGIVKMGGGSVKKSVYGGGELSQVNGNTNVSVTGGTIGTTGLGASTYGNIYGGGFGSTDDVRFGLIKGNTNVTVENVVADATYATAHEGINEGDVISTPTILHNIYGGGAYGSVGTFTYESTAADAKITGHTSGGTANITITGGTIGSTGKENGMIFGSSRGDVGAPNSIHDRLAWVYDTHVEIGTSGATTGPQIKGSVYGGGENGHNYHDAEVYIYSGTIGIHDTDDDVTYKDNKKHPDEVTYQGKDYNYPYRGNVYGGGCGTDKYYSDPSLITEGHTATDGEGDKYNSLAGIVRGDATINITGGTVIHNVYGAGAMGSVGNFEKNATTNVITFTSGGTTTIAISGGIVGVDGSNNGNIYGAARGDAAFTDKDLALVKETSVTISGTTTTTQIKGNVYGGGEVGNVYADTKVDIQGGAIAKNVFGGGKGVEDLFTCEQAMVGVDGEGADAVLDSDENKNKGTIVTISNGTVGTLSGGNLVEGTGNVYGGGEIGRVEWNTQVKIGVGTGEGTFAPTIYGNVFGAGKGLKTHGYSALVRGNSTVTIQGGAKIGENVYGGGEMSTVGRYWVKGINNKDAGGSVIEAAKPVPEDLPDGMPYKKQSGGICKVYIQGNAEIGTNGTDDKGHVFGAGKGVDLLYNASTSKKKIGNNDLVPFTAEIDENSQEIIKTAEQLYYEFLQTLALVTESHVTIDGSAQVKGSVFGGSESGFVQANTDVKIQGSGCVIGTTTYGNVFGGGKGLEYFAEAGKVKGNTAVAVSAGNIKGNIYGGGSLGDVGTIDKTDKKEDGQLTYNYKWKQSDGVTANVAEYNIPSSTSTHDTSKNTGICTVTISGGTIGLSSTSEPTKQHGNVFGAGRGSSTTWWCEKAIAYATDVSVTKGTVYGNVYGGGEVGRVEDDTKVTIGAKNGTDEFTIKGNVFGAGAGKETHGYSALVRGNAEVTVQGKAQVGGSVYGGGEIASVGRFHVVGGLPRNPQAGGTCTVKIQGEAKIGSSGTTGHNVFGACKGVTPTYDNTQGSTDRSKSMQLEANRPKVKDPVTGEDTETVKPEHEFWDYCETYSEGYTGTKFVWVYYETETDYQNFLKTLALTSNTHVTVDGSSEIYGSVYGGGERGITLGGVDVNMTSGTVYEDVYGGGSLADSNTAMWDATNNTLHDYAELELIPGLSVITGYYTAKSPETLIKEEDAKATGTKYYAIYKTNVNLTGGTIKGNAYGGGLGRKEYGTSGQEGYVSPIEAMVYGDVLVELNNNNDGGPADGNKTGCAVTHVFGCNNLNGTPKGKVKVHVYATQNANKAAISTDKTSEKLNSGTYDVQAVYGGGNLAKYEPVDALLEYNATNKAKVDAARAEVIIDGCELTSIKQVYGGGNAASVPATFVEINGTYEIDEVFGGGNGADNYSLKEGDDDVWYQNPGANVGYYNYTITGTSGSKPGTKANPYYLAVDDERFDTKDERLADNTAAAAMRYGSGIARLEVYGGTIHTSYGGSNSRGNVRTLLSSVYSANGGCTMAVGTSYGGGKDAVSDGKVDMLADCAHGITEMFGGSKNADVDNDINLKITNGSTLERVFGGNNTSGAINGSITVTIEEGGCEPIRIDNLYLGGFLAPYSVYGYKKTNGTYDYIEKEDEEGNTIQERIPLMKGEEGALTTPRKDPCLYVISATHIGNIFGGGYKAKLVGNPHVNVNMKQGKVSLTRTGTEGAYVYKDAMDTEYTENVTSETTGEGTSAVTKYYATLPVGDIGNIYGGGNMADIIGDTYVEIGTGTWHNANGGLETEDANGVVYTYNETTKKWSYKDDGGTHEVNEAPTPARNAANITENVFGGGKGIEDSFTCEKAMVNSAVVNNVEQGGGNTSVIIGNGTIGGTVYGGGQIGRVEHNTTVTIGLESGTDEPVIGLKTGTDEPIIMGNVFGAGRGVHTHGYAALVRGNTTVTVQGNAKVRKSVYGGGEIASVGKYDIADAAYHSAHPEVLEGMPYSLVSDNRGICNVIVKGNAVIGPEGSMEMPNSIGHVFGAGKGVLPYQDIDGNDITNNNTVDPWRMKPGDIVETFNETTFSEEYYTDLYGANYNKKLYNYLADYLRFIETLALTTKTEVTVGGNAFVKGSVYGGSENGHVQHDTHVTIQDDCQIGHSKGVSTRFTEEQWQSKDAAIKPCATWNYVANEGAPYDPLATSAGTYNYDNYQFVPEADRLTSSKGGKPTATDGHTFYGNVFGGGSGLIPYAPGKWHRNAGSVGGNTVVDISGGHIMTSVYGGNEQTDVGTYILDPDNGYQPTIPKSGGKCTINMTSGTVGVPRTVEDILKYPTISNVFGAGKGDQRIFFNTWTNVIETEINISGDARIYGSTFGGGEDGHVIGDAKTNIGTVTIDNTQYTGDDVIIGSTGTSYMDGNVFGGGRGFSGEAQTAGTVGGNVVVKISGGKILGSVYGGGRLASVGTLFTALDHPNYGNFQEDTNSETYGHVTINISGGTIGNDLEIPYASTVETAGMTAEEIKVARDAEIANLKNQHGLPNTVFEYDSENNRYVVSHSTGGNVFGGSMGRLTLLNGSINENWPKMAQVKSSTVTISGDAIVKRNVYGGGELGTVRDDAVVTINGGTVRRDVYGGGYGSDDFNTKTTIHVKEPKVENPDPTKPEDYKTVDYKFTPMIFAGCVGKSTTVNVNDGWVRKSVYGGGEMASVGIIDCRVDGDGKYINFHEHNDAENGFVLSWPYHFEYTPGYGGAAQVNVTGGRIGVKVVSGEDNDDIASDNGDVYGAGKGIAGDYKDYVYCANVGSAEVNINYTSSNTTLDPKTYEASGDCITGAVYGGGENGHVMGDAKLTLENGLIGHSIYGGGSGKGKFTKWLTKIPADRRTVVTSGGTGTAPNTNTNGEYEAECYSITAGKVFGNTEIDMKGGYVIRNVYGGGNMASVGKGNYSGGDDDYSKAGYGETLSGNLWDGVSQFSQAFLSSGKCTVTITGGKVGYIGYDASDPLKFIYPRNLNTGLPYGNVFGGCRGESAPNILESPRYLYCPEFFLGYVNATDVTIGKSDGTGPAILGSVYGGGMDGHVRRDTKVTINGGEIGSEYTTAECANVGTSELSNIMWLHRGNVYGAGSGIGKYKYDFNYDGDFGDVIKYTTPSTSTTSGRTTTMKEEDYSTSAGSVTRFTEVIVNGGKIHRNVYGGGSLSSIGGPKIPPITDDPIRRDDNATATQGKQSMNKVTITGGQIGDESSFDDDGNHVFGGYVFGASRGNENLDNPSSFATSAWTDVNIKPHATDASKNPVIYADVYGGGEVGTVRQSTDVDLTGGIIKHDAYGGGRGTSSVAANVGADAKITLNKDVASDKKGCIVTRIFGCNNVNGSPQGHVTVHVYATQNMNKETIIDGKTTANLHTAIEAVGTPSTYDVAAVYGGGNMAPYYPSTTTESTESTEVIIDGCNLTSIKQVYGGGNAASTPATSVTVNGTYEIEELFGGGNGADDLPDGSPNPGANVGYKDYHLVEPNFTTKESRVNGEGFAEYRYGSGVATVNVFGGLVHHVFGGSNTKGNVRKTALTLLEEKKEDGETPCCPFQVDEAYGGGKSAPMDAEAILHMACIPGLKVAYGGAQEADVQDNVTLTITNGTFDRVFGGNNISGTIRGSITVNIEETGCKPIIIGELYGGGNQAGYSIFGYKEVTEGNNKVWKPRQPGDGLESGMTVKYLDPVVNVKSFTSIGNVYGGGYGGSAEMVGDPTVNVNVAMGEKASETAAVIGKDGDKWKDMAVKDGKIVAKDTEDSYPIPYHKSGEIGAISNVFGGGNAAKVVGNTTVNVGTKIGADEFMAVNVKEGDPLTGEGIEYYTREGDNYTLISSGTAVSNVTYYKKYQVEGVDIRGNVYGGGNAAEVTGNTNVVIGKEAPATSTGGGESGGGSEPSNP